MPKSTKLTDRYLFQKSKTFRDLLKEKARQRKQKLIEDYRRTVMIQDGEDCVV